MAETSNSSSRDETASRSAKKRSPQRTDSRAQSSTERAPSAQSKPKPRSGDVAKRAAAEFHELTDKSQEGIVGLARTENGWTVQIEVVEVRRIPDTTDVLGIYEIDTDSSGSLEGYRRVRRYVRGSGEEGS